VSVKDRTVLALMASFDYHQTACRVLWGPISRVAFVTTMSNCTSLLHVVLLVFRGRMRPRAQTSSREQGPIST
jgi:hypothetical protein